MIEHLMESIAPTEKQQLNNKLNKAEQTKWNNETNTMYQSMYQTKQQY
jgi:hypothetical protein